MAHFRFRLFSAIFTAFALAIFAGCQSAPKTPPANLPAGYQAYQNHDYAAAHNTAAAFVLANPNSPNIDEAYYLAGLAQEARGHVAAAETDYLAAIGHSNRPQLISKSSAALGDIVYAAGKFQRAIAYYQRASQVDPSVGLSVAELMRLAISQQNVGDWGAANATFSAIEQAAPGTTAALIAEQRYGQNHFCVQFGAYNISAAAWNENRLLRVAGIQALVIAQSLHGQTLYLVQSGFFSTFKAALAARTVWAVRQPQAIVVP